MKTTYDERREKALKERRFLFGKVCHCCDTKISMEKMWTAKFNGRYSQNRICFCKECVPTREDALEKIKSHDVFKNWL